MHFSKHTAVPSPRQLKKNRITDIVRWMLLLLAILLVDAGPTIAQTQTDPIPPPDELIDEPIFVGTYPMDSFTEGRIDRDLWAYKDVAFYAPPGEVDPEIGKQWIQWYAVTDQLYWEMSQALGVSAEEFDQVFRQSNGNLNRRMKRVAIVPNSCGVGCGNKNGAETAFGTSHFLAAPDDWSLQGHWTLYYEFGRGGRGERYQGRGMWPTNTILEPHLIAGLTFYELGGLEGLQKGIPGDFPKVLESWQASGLKYIEFFSEPGVIDPGDFDSHGIMNAMLLHIAAETNRETVFAILSNMAQKEIATSAEMGMCDFQDAVNTATNNQFEARMVHNWGLPECGRNVEAPIEPSFPLKYSSGAIAYDSFESTSGQSLAEAGGGSGWANNWSVTLSEGVTQQHLDGSLVYKTVEYNALPSEGNRLNVIVEAEETGFAAERMLAQPISSGDVWFSLRAKRDRSSAGGLFIGTTQSGDSRIGKAWGQALSIHNDRTEENMRLFITYNLVAKYELNPNGVDTIYLWVNPDPTQEPQIADADVTKTAEIGTIDRVTIRIEPWGLGNYVIDEVRFGYPVSELDIALGDVNCDGQVNVVDALYIMQHEVRLRADTNACPAIDTDMTLLRQVGDVNANENVDVIDALIIMQCEAQIANSFCSQ